MVSIEEFGVESEKVPVKPFLWTSLFSPPKAHCAYHVCRRGSSTKKRWIRPVSSINLGPRVRVHTFKMSWWPTKHIITWRTEVGTVSGMDCWGRRAQSVLRVGPDRAQLQQSKRSRGSNSVCTADLPARAASDGLRDPCASSLVCGGRNCFWQLVTTPGTVWDWPLPRRWCFLGRASHRCLPHLVPMSH